MPTTLLHLIYNTINPHNYLTSILHFTFICALSTHPSRYGYTHLYSKTSQDTFKREIIVSSPFHPKFKYKENSEL